MVMETDNAHQQNEIKLLLVDLLLINVELKKGFQQKIVKKLLVWMGCKCIFQRRRKEIRKNWVGKGYFITKDAKTV